MKGPFGAPKTPSDEAYRHAMAAAMRLDAAHRCLEDVRQADALRCANSGSFTQHDAYFGLWGESQLLVIALHRALRMITDAPAHTRSAPRLIRWKSRQLIRMRDAFEHIDDRAVGLVSRHQKGPEAPTAFESELAARRRIGYGGVSLSIDTEATQLFVVARQHLLKWAL